MEVPAAQAIKTIRYNNLKGVDFSTDEAYIDRKRSPDMVNMISDEGGIPIKRKGYETVGELNNCKILEIWSFREGGNVYYVVLVDNKTTNTTELKSFSLSTGFENAATIEGGGTEGTAIYMSSENNKGLYIFNGTKYIRAYVEFGQVIFEEVEAFVPTIIISRTPTGGGNAYEEINMLTRKRKEFFLNTTGNKSFLVTSQINQAEPYKGFYRNSSGGWTEISGITVSGAKFTVPTAYEPVIVGQDNVYFEYSAVGESGKEKISNCRSSAFFTKSTQDNIFVSSNKEMSQMIWYSASGDPTYFPDLNYIYASGEGEVMGFSKIGDYLAVIKQTGEGSCFLIYQDVLSSVTETNGDTTTTTDKIIYGIKQAVTGIGAVSRRTFSTVNDEPLFFSEQGIQGLISTSITSDKIIRNRSVFLNGKLTKESLLESAVATMYNNYYFLALNGKMYILDGRQKSGDAKNNTDYAYEGYYWEDIPAVCITSSIEGLVFGTEDGKVCKFKDKGDRTDYSDDGKPILARWSTMADNDNSPSYYKNMQKKGTQVSLMPTARATVKVYAEKDGATREFLKEIVIQDGVYLAGASLSMFSFDSAVTMKDIVLRKKQKKYKRLKLIIENDALNENFGIYEVVKAITIQSIARR